MYDNSKREYLESDIYTAAHLMCCGHKLLGLEKLEKGKKAFRFQDRDRSALDAAFVFKEIFVKALRNRLESAGS